MVTEMVCAGFVDNIASLIGKCDFLSEALVLLEKLPKEIVDKHSRQNLLCFAKFPPPINDLAEYTSGRIFREGFELRWEKKDSGVQVVYLGEERAVPMLKVTRDVDLALCTQRIKHYYLFGTRLESDKLQRIGEPAQEGDFAEVRIPRLLRYPVEKQLRYAKLGIYEYLHQYTNELVMFRFHSLTEVPE